MHFYINGHQCLWQLEKASRASGFSFFIHQFFEGILEKEDFEFSVFPLKDKETKALQQATPIQKMAHVDPERCQLLFDDTSVKLSAH